jgi:N-acetylglucosaminyl-diphospho-decaprenol L-rhamnosyltransferase
MQPSPSQQRVYAIIVSHNSAGVLEKAMAALAAQSVPLVGIILTDCGSADRGYLQTIQAGNTLIKILFEKNLGFAAGNNHAIAQTPDDATHFLFVNPDCFLAPDWLEQALAYHAEHPHTVLSSPLQGYDLATDTPSGVYDSLGIQRLKTGRFIDAGQGQPLRDLGNTPIHPDALCGALMLVPAKAVRTLSAQPGGFFDARFFMYKEDIDTSLRLTKAGYTLTILPTLNAWHCRGWNKDRSKTSRFARRLSARNNLRLACKHPGLWIYLPVYSAQYCYVRFLEK